MRKYRLLLISAYLICRYRVNGNTTGFFRTDYTLHSEVGTFYKAHKNPKSWNEARKWCMLEGATLAVPKTGIEADIYKTIMDDKLDAFVHSVYVGIQAFSKGLFTSLDGTPIDNLYHNWRPNEPNDLGNNEDCLVIDRLTNGLNDVPCDHSYPFICEKSQDSVKWNNDCQIADPDYRRLDGMQHCYKLHKKKKNWADSYATCTAEQSYLAILNSEEESNALKQLVASESGGNVQRYEIFHLGFHDRYAEGEFKTIQGMTLHEAGFETWDSDPYQPDHPGLENCGSMYGNGKLNDITCSIPLLFICELENNSALSTRMSG
uniref:Immulectin 15 n=1 Tax=Hepialus xiaojinensis TaxID=1589740 RepID=A0A219YXI3_9NEOP|nr:immulectin 15 [Hepialus xiaojinensis]